MSSLHADIIDFLHSEALALDERRWEDWLAHFDAQCEYWVPAWKSEDEQTSDPMRELSLIYYADRSGLEDRVFRVRSGRSVASVVLPRTQHNISNVMVLDASEAGTVSVACNWTVHQYLPKEKVVQIFFGRYEETLIRKEDALRIKKKKIILLNGDLPAKIDFYSL